MTPKPIHGAEASSIGRARRALEEAEVAALVAGTVTEFARRLEKSVFDLAERAATMGTPADAIVLHVMRVIMDSRRDLVKVSDAATERMHAARHALIDAEAMAKLGRGHDR